VAGEREVGGEPVADPSGQGPARGGELAGGRGGGGDRRGVADPPGVFGQDGRVRLAAVGVGGPGVLFDPQEAVGDLLGPGPAGSVAAVGGVDATRARSTASSPGG